MSNTQNETLSASDLPVLKTLPDLVTRQVALQPHKTAFIFEGDSLSYKDLDDGSNRIANGLLAWDLKADERVGYLGKNAHHYYELLFGVAKAGGVLCPINWRLALPEIVYVLNDFKPKIFLIGTEFMELVPALKEAVPSILHIVPMEEDEGFDTHYTTWRDSWNIWSEQDVSLIPMPCFHIGGTAWGLTTLAHGATGVIMRNFVPTDVLGYIDKYKISKLFLVPAAIQIVVNQPEVHEIDFSQLKFIFYGASPMPLPLLETAIDIFGCGFAQFYGMTETSGTISALPPEDHDINGNTRMRSVGKALRGVEIVILDDKGNKLKPHEIGEITTRSTMNMNGYLNLPDVTNETLTGGGWLRTGDIGYLDEDGYLFLKDRKKDMIISGGENIYPAEVENALVDHPSVAEVSVIGIPSKKWGEAVKACIVIKGGETLTEAEAINWARGKIAKFKCPKSVSFLDVLPRNPSGKVLRRILRETYSK